MESCVFARPIPPGTWGFIPIGNKGGEYRFQGFLLRHEFEMTFTVSGHWIVFPAWYKVDAVDHVLDTVPEGFDFSTLSHFHPSNPCVAPYVVSLR